MSLCIVDDSVDNKTQNTKMNNDGKKGFSLSMCASLWVCAQMMTVNDKKWPTSKKQQKIAKT